MIDDKDMKISPKECIEASVMAQEVGKEMLARLEWMKIQPAVILDVSSAGSTHSKALSEFYPQASVITLSEVNLPLANNSVDIVFANFFLPWQQQVSTIFQEWLRVLKPNGLLLFSALGPDSLREWQHTLPASELPTLVDMHEIGDALIQAGFQEPVADVNYYTVTYRDPSRLLQELYLSQMWMPVIIPDFNAVGFDIPAAEEGVWPVTYEVVFAHAFTANHTEQTFSADEGVAKIPLAHLRGNLQGRR